MCMVTIVNENFNIKQIAQSGQCFRMDMLDEKSCRLISGSKYLRLEQDADRIIFHCTEEEFADHWADYFDLDTDYKSMINAIDKDDLYLSEAARFGSGIRILRQEIWETIVSFLISQQNNITRIKRCISNISEKYGESCISDDGTGYFAFPKAETLACLPEDELMKCNLGYRSKYVVRTARMVAEGSFDTEALFKMEYPEARAKLKELYGVGNKVADCVCLFGLHLIEAFPIDTHIIQVLSEHYSEKAFPFERYDGFAGVIQQYMFYYDLDRQR